MFDRDKIVFQTHKTHETYSISLSCRPSEAVTVDVSFPDTSLGFYFEEDFVPKWEWDPTNLSPYTWHRNPKSSNYQFPVKPGEWDQLHGVLLENRYSTNPPTKCGTHGLWQRDWGDDITLANTIKVSAESPPTETSAGPILSYDDPPDCPGVENQSAAAIGMSTDPVDEGQPIEVKFTYRRTGRGENRQPPQSLFYNYILYVQGHTLSSGTTASMADIAEDFPLIGRFVIPKDSLKHQNNSDADQSFTFTIPTVCREGVQGKRQAVLQLRDRSPFASLVNSREPGLTHAQARITINADSGDGNCGGNGDKGGINAPLNLPDQRISGGRITSVSHNTIDLSWEAATGATDYEVQFRRSGSGSDWYRALTITPSIVLYGLTPQTKYEVHVYPVVRGITGGFLASAKLSATTSAVPLPRPRIADINIGERTHDSISLSWPAVTGAESYQVRYWMAGKKSKTSKTAEVETPSATLEGLKADRRYVIRVGYKMDGELVSGKVSHRLKVKTLKAPPDNG